MHREPLVSCCGSRTARRVKRCGLRFGRTSVGTQCRSRAAQEHGFFYHFVDSADWREVFASGPDGLRQLVQQIVQEVLEAEMDETVGAQKGKRTPERSGYRSGYYTRTLVTRVGKLALRVPQDRQGRFRMEVFERYQRSEKALVCGRFDHARAAFFPSEASQWGSMQKSQPVVVIAIEELFVVHPFPARITNADLTRPAPALSWASVDSGAPKHAWLGGDLFTQRRFNVRGGSRRKLRSGHAAKELQGGFPVADHFIVFHLFS
jgi:hypothetical protein